MTAGPVSRRLPRALAALVLAAAAAACGGSGSSDAAASEPRQAAAPAAGAATAEAPADSPLVVVYKTPTCGCCRAWVDHMRANGFRVETHDTADVQPVKTEQGVPGHLASCHTGIVDGYVIEGHVPADVIRRVLRERPQIAGVAVPGMPMGSPGMEVPGRPADKYDIVAFTRDGKTRVYESR